jgi:hypothetical protein
MRPMWACGPTPHRRGVRFFHLEPIGDFAPRRRPETTAAKWITLCLYAPNPQRQPAPQIPELPRAAAIIRKKRTLAILAAPTGNPHCKPPRRLLTKSARCILLATGQHELAPPGTSVAGLSLKKSRLYTGRPLRDCKGRLEALRKATSRPGPEAWRDDATSRIAF